jgi:hypothetical protein
MSFRLMRRPGVAIACLALLAVSPASAKIKKFMNPCKEQMLCAFFRASVAVPEGWVEDQAATRHFGAVILLQKGVAFNDSQATIYAVARYNPKRRPLSEFVSEAIGELSGVAKGAKVTVLPDQPRAAGEPPFARHSLEAPSQTEQGYELHAVTGDSDDEGNQYVVTITLSANSKAAMIAAEPAYLSVLSKY